MENVPAPSPGTNGLSRFLTAPILNIQLLYVFAVLSRQRRKLLSVTGMVRVGLLENVKLLSGIRIHCIGRGDAEIPIRTRHVGRHWHPLVERLR